MLRGRCDGREDDKVRGKGNATDGGCGCVVRATFGSFVVISGDFTLCRIDEEVKEVRYAIRVRFMGVFYSVVDS